MRFARPFTATSVLKTEFFIPISSLEKGATSGFRVLAIEYIDCILAEELDLRRCVLIWHETIWLLVSSNLGVLGNAVYLLHCHLSWVHSDRVLSMGQMKENYVFLLNWIVWNRIVLMIKLRAYVKLNLSKRNCFCMLNWIVLNRTVFDVQLCVNKNCTCINLCNLN